VTTKFFSDLTLLSPDCLGIYEATLAESFEALRPTLKKLIVLPSNLKAVVSNPNPINKFMTHIVAHLSNSLEYLGLQAGSHFGLVGFHKNNNYFNADNWKILKDMKQLTTLKLCVTEELFAKYMNIHTFDATVALHLENNCPTIGINAEFATNLTLMFTTLLHRTLDQHAYHFANLLVPRLSRLVELGADPFRNVDLLRQPCFPLLKFAFRESPLYVISSGKPIIIPSNTLICTAVRPLIF